MLVVAELHILEELTFVLGRGLRFLSALLILASLISLRDLTFMNDFIFFVPVKISQITCVVQVLLSRSSIWLSASAKASIFCLTTQKRSLIHEGGQ